MEKRHNIGLCSVIFLSGQRAGNSSKCLQSSFGLPPAFEYTCSSERGLGDCAHARDVVLAKASMTCVVQALFK